MSSRLGKFFRRNIAIIVAINDYRSPIQKLGAAVPDALAVAATLERDHGFEVVTLLDQEATGDKLRLILKEALPRLLGPQDRLFLYFAVHGVAVGDMGFLVLANAQSDDPKTFFAMGELHDRLLRLQCHHLLLVLDCCFAGAFPQSHHGTTFLPPLLHGDSEHDAPPVMPLRPYGKRLESCLHSRAWEVLMAGAHNQTVLDALAPPRRRARALQQSPFARAFLQGLRGNADYTHKRIVTAQQLSVYVRDRVERAVRQAGWRQWPQHGYLAKHSGGEFVFEVPNRSRAVRKAKPSLYDTPTLLGDKGQPLRLPVAPLHASAEAELPSPDTALLATG
jgi:Caspase domain